ncbi:hypothetical protein [Cryptosporangium sp. NPDC048952]|uniref:hypothetical protein n=1 Tax=Cryptosporangium sp. NPDC048952 TaxID=3363961 RepID=UPI003711D920
MTDLDTALRDLYTGRADRAPSGSDLLDAVHDRARRDRRKRMLAGIAAVVAVVLLGGLGTAIAFRPREDRTLQITDGKSMAPPPAPISVGSLPEGFVEPDVQYLGQAVWDIESHRASSALSVQVMSYQPAVRPGSGRRETIRVGDAEGTLYWLPPSAAADPASPDPTGPFAELTYQRKPGQWIRIVAVDTVRTMSQAAVMLVLIASGITDEKSPVVDTIRMTLPAGTTWGRVLGNGPHSRVTLDDAGTRPAAVGLNDLPNSHRTEQRSRLIVEVLDKDSEDVALLPRFAGQDRRLKSSEIPPEGIVIAIGSQLMFVHLVAGSDRAAVIIKVDASEPLADGGTMRTLAESVRLGVDAKIR